VTRRLLALSLLGLFVWILGSLAPFFLRNLRLQQYMENLTQAGQNDTRSADVVRAQVVERARELGLPVEAGHVQAELVGTRWRVSARYLVPVELPGYTVKLHFAPSAGR